MADMASAEPEPKRRLVHALIGKAFARYIRFVAATSRGTQEGGRNLPPLGSCIIRAASSNRSPVLFPGA